MSNALLRQALAGPAFPVSLALVACLPARAIADGGDRIVVPSRPGAAG